MFPTCRAVFFPVAGLVLGLISPVHAQAVHANPALPESPGFTLQTLAQATPLNAASLAGVVVDTTGAAVPSATITLVDGNGANEKLLPAGLHGEFLFLNLPAGNFRLTVVAPGMETFVSAQLRLTATEHLLVPEIVLPIEPSNTRVEVNATEQQVAQEQMKDEEKQRAFGVLPNFYTSYTWDAAPLNFKQKSELAFRSVTDPVEFVLVGAVAGVEQARNTFPGYGDDAAGYGRRFGAAYGDVVFSRAIGSAILPTLLHQDPRYFYLGSGSTSHRFGYALAAAVICKGDSGHFQFNFSRLLGSAAAGSISYAYHPGERSPTLIGRNVAIGFAGAAATNLVREFVLRRFTPSVPDYKRGKPVDPNKK